MRLTTLHRGLPLAVLVAGFVLLGAAPAADDKDEGLMPLFNGKDLTGFKFFLDPKAAGANPADTWSVTADGYIRCTGKPAGYFYTDKSYKNYVVRYDWRYPEGSKPQSNSGCLVHIQEPHAIWPKSVEPQGRYMDHGRLFFPGGVKPIGEPTFDAEALKKVLKPMGEWSSTEVTCAADGTVSVKVNGAPISSGKTALTEGPIGWQSEGAEIHFRNIKIKQAK